MPIIDANIDVTGEPRLQGKFNRSMVVEKGGQKIGIVGFITTDTAFISDAGEYMLHCKNNCNCAPNLVAAELPLIFQQAH